MIKITKKKKYGYTVRDKKGFPKTEKMTVKQAKKRVSKNLKKSSTKKPKQKERKQKEKYLVNLKREKALAEKGWKVARTTGYLKKPKKAIGKKGYPYAVLNKNNNYETFYAWKEKPSKERKGTVRHEAFKKQQAKLYKKSQRKVKIESLKKSRKRKF